MATIVTRSGKGSPLTHTEVDSNFSNLNNDKLESGSTASSLTITSADINGGTIDGVTIGGSSAGAITGTTITGTSFVTSGDMTFGDNDKAIFGAGSDLQIYHNGNDSVINENTAGNLLIQGDNIYLQNSTNTRSYLRGVDGGAVDIRYNGSSKLATTSTGIDVTGKVVLDTSLDLGTAGIYGQLSAVESGTTGLDITANGSGRLALQSGGVDALAVSNGGDISFYEDTGTTPKFFWDASAESLGIGDTTPTEGKVTIRASSAQKALWVEGYYTGEPTVEFYRDNTDTQYVLELRHDGPVVGTGGSGYHLNFTDRVGAGIGYIRSEGGGTGSIHIGSNNFLRLDTNGAERMRIDSSGNVLVGKTSVNFGIAGCQLISGSGGSSITSDGIDTLGLNRLSSDGAIIGFYKNSSSVGSIGASGGTIYAGKGSSGVIFNDGATKDLIPYSVTASDTVDNTINLGISSKRFKNLYLSGGVYLGGTGSANYLDDYEEGTWAATLTPNSGSLTAYTVNNAYYTKVGRKVTITMRFTTTTVGTASGGLNITGMPFLTIHDTAMAGEIQSTGGNYSGVISTGGILYTYPGTYVNGYNYVISLTYFTS